MGAEMSGEQYWMTWKHPDVTAGLNAAAAEQKWYLSDTFRRYPPKSQVRASVERVLEGWTPATPIIHPLTRVLAIGSCFAANFIEWLIAHDYNLPLKDNPYAGLLRNAFESASVVAQQFRWAFGEFDPTKALWFDKNKRLVEPTEERRSALQALLEQTEVLVVTLGLSEVWYDTQTGEPLWRVMPVDYYDPARHAFKVQTVAETVQALEAIDSIRSRYLPNLKILFTVSPLRLRATFRPVSAVTANSVSKAVIRAALDEFFRSRSDLNSTYFYFPSYEIVTDVVLDPFAEDQHHLHEYVLAFVLDTFARHYTTFAPVERPAVDIAPPLERRLQLIEQAYDERLNQLAVSTHHCAQSESEVAMLRQVCDERLAMIERMSGEIDILRQACEERLLLIHNLSHRAA